MKTREFHRVLEMLRDLGHTIDEHYLEPDGGHPIKAYDIDGLWRFRVRRSNISGPELI